MPDIPRIYTAIAEWVACMLFILPVKKRFDRLKTGLLAAGALIIQSLFLMVTGNVRIYFWIPCMVIAVLLMIGFIYGCCEISLRDAGYFGMIAVVAAEFMASVEWQVVWFFRDGRVPSLAIQAVVFAVVYFGDGFLFF